jgi:hypothetical protein
MRQGSILGPMLYLVHVADMPDVVGVKDGDNSGYANNTAIWATGRTVAEVVQKTQCSCPKICLLLQGKWSSSQCRQDSTPLLCDGGKC